MPQLLAYLPLSPYPEAAPDPAILATLGLGAALGCAVQVTTLALDVPSTASPVGGFLINVEGMARAAEARSAAECQRLEALVRASAGPEGRLTVSTRRAVMGAAPEAAAAEARLFDLALVPWAPDMLAAQDMAQALVFGAGVPVVLVPAGAAAAPIDHLAIAWDGSRVAARALRDALPLLPAGGRVTVVTVQGEKAPVAPGMAQALASALERRGLAAQVAETALEGRPIAVALQEAARGAGAGLLAMGGFGHSRLRDFILGGATKGVLADLRMPVLLSH